MPPEERTNDSPPALGQAIVAFIDILGYSKLVERLINDFDAIKYIEDLLDKTSIGFIETIREKLSIPEPYHEYSIELVRAINVNFISDTILVTLPLSKTKIPSPDFNEKEILFHCVFFYLRFIGFFSTMFMAKTGLVLRGGISMGPHYENQHGASLFIFSQAYLNACRLEKKANFPRILIDKELFLLLKKLPLDEISNFFYDDEGEKCLDIYAHFERIASYRSVLEEIKKGLSLNLLQNREKKSALAKLLYFVKFHNRRVIRLGLDDLAINISKIEEHFHSL